MKIALLLSGSPRFYSGFDTFTGILEGHAVGWYCHFWQENLPPDKLGYDNYILVSDSWRHVDKTWAVKKISENLPDMNRLVSFETYDSDLIEYPVITGPQVHHENFKSIWKMHLGWKMVDTMRQNSNIEYDLVIRARPDSYLPEFLDLSSVKSFIDQNPNSVMISRNGQHGYGYVTNDLVAISGADQMIKYTDLINCSLEYNRQGIVFHPETLLAYHLQKNGLVTVPNLNVEIRHQTVNLPDGNITVDFGRWQ